MENILKYPAYEWELLQNTHYQRINLGNTIWDPIDPVAFSTAIAPCGGAIALTRSDSNIQKNFKFEEIPLYSICVFSLTGSHLQTFTWDKVSIAGMGWNDNEELIVLSKQGQVRVYNILGEFHQYSIGKGIEKIGVKECRFSSGAVFARLQDDSFISLSGLDEPRRKNFAKIPSELMENGNLSSWNLIPNQFSLDLGYDVLVSIGNQILQIDEQDVQVHNIPSSGTIHQFSVSPNSRYIALYEDKGKIRVISSDFTKVLLDFQLPDTISEAILKQMTWCSNDAVVLVHDNLVTLVGPFGGSVPFLYNQTPIVYSEIDGVRVLNKEKCEFLRRVPSSLEQVFELQSRSPATRLVEASQKMKSKSVFAEKLLLEMKNDMHIAVDTCTQAALHEFSIEWQKELLEAASLGKNTLTAYNHQEFVDISREMRVLNSARSPSIGIYITHDQLEHLGFERLIQRISRRKQYGTAVQAAQYLNLPCDWVYIEWAQTYLKQSNEPEDVVLNNIVDKLSKRKFISYEKVARTAYEEGRIMLSTKLLDFEPLANHQVMLLLNMESYEQAMSRVIETSDYDLILYVILQIKQQMSIASFFQILNTHPNAAQVYVEFAKQNDRKTLHDFFYQDDDRKGLAILAIEDTLTVNTFNERIASLQTASKVCGESKEFALESKLLDEQVKLLQLEEAYESQLASNFVGLTINELIVKLIELNQNQKASKIRSEFGVPEKRFSWLKLRALVAIRDWLQIEQWAASMRRSPIGFEPFVNEILSAGNKREAAKYIPRCTQISTQEKVDLWIQVGDVKSASEEAAEAKSGNLLGELLERVQNMPESRLVQNALGQLRR
ncbi:HOPS complex subunit Vps16 [Schizosaccharomyces cryophilus OY26]|uniref:Probable vacuolar protein sorting-associated protein 16 homolog n=1 Tax=Schizosaccharomyces cryophilus (strain OY26 / ATCC MYA-4695 / CBS 11777 / NBRC 106824 / NRRL Y48691) TaxID=653667 RepID=S9VU25_SCHCR|nr:HOPS complex subunit Vps16 [Schizosaccharomyces cryophilus OY26]EPY49689.1 HOPS complex subunit Vps16 [Schizosaccharomyces cryophilus OY26]